MKPYRANAINGLVLVILGFLGYFTSLDPTAFGLIPPILGIIFIATTPLLKKNKQWLYFFIIGLNLLLMGFLTQQSIEAFGNDNETRLLSRMITMLFSSALTAFIFVKYYLDNRWRI